MTVTTYTFPPDITDVRAYLRVPVTVLTDDELQMMLDAASTDQVTRCTWSEGTDDPLTYPAPLMMALMRRVQREVAARNLPLGMVGLEQEYGPARIPALDALVDMHEHPYRRQVLA